VIGLAQESLLAERGWLVVDLPDARPVLHARRLLLDHLREDALPALTRLDDYHRHVDDDGRHDEILHDLTAFYWGMGLGRAIVERNLEVFHVLVGRDLHVQRRPALRASRPEKSQDVMALHRDTYYGASPYELSVVVPFTDVDASGALRVVSRSHLAADADIPYIQDVSPDVVSRSPKHQLGFPYAPRALAPALDARAEPIPLRTGQALVFGLALVYGSALNTGGRTRISTEIRVVNSLAPRVPGRGTDASSYGPLCVSPLSDAARRYLAINDGTRHTDHASDEARAEA